MRSELERVLTADPRTLDLSEFVIAKELTKPAADYATPPPHVRVAMDMEARGVAVRTRDRIPYLVQRAGKSVGDKAVHPDAWSWRTHELDTAWYAKQITQAMRRVLELSSEDVDAVFAHVSNVDTATGSTGIMRCLGAEGVWRKRVVPRASAPPAKRRQLMLADLFKH